MMNVSPPKPGEQQPTAVKPKNIQQPLLISDSKKSLTRHPVTDPKKAGPKAAGGTQSFLQKSHNKPVDKKNPIQNNMYFPNQPKVKKN